MPISTEQMCDQWRNEIDVVIDRYRKFDCTIKIVNNNNEPLPNIDIKVTQNKHTFGFGSCIRNDHIGNSQYEQFFCDNFEWGVMEYESKWRAIEREKGKHDYSQANKILNFTKANGIKLRGHTIFWEGYQYEPEWVYKLPVEQLEKRVRQRLIEVVHYFKNDFIHWDVINEMLQGSFYKDKLGNRIYSEIFKRVKDIAPNVKLFVNEHGVITGLRTREYKEKIQQLINEGAVIDGIGVQGHFASTVLSHPVNIIIEKLDILATLNIPIWITEFDVSDKDLKSRADQIETMYRIAFSHPSVEGIMMWGFWEGTHCRGPDSSIVDLDWSVNEAGLRYKNLLAQWTTKEQGLTNEKGEFNFRGFSGTYNIYIVRPNKSEIIKQTLLEKNNTYNFSITDN